MTLSTTDRQKFFRHKKKQTHDQVQLTVFVSKAVKARLDAERKRTGETLSQVTDRLLSPVLGETEHPQPNIETLVRKTVKAELAKLTGDKTGLKVDKSVTMPIPEQKPITIESLPKQDACRHMKAGQPLNLFSALQAKSAETPISEQKPITGDDIPQNIGQEELAKLILESGFNISKIAKEHGVTKQAVFCRMKKHGVKIEKVLKFAVVVEEKVGE